MPEFSARRVLLSGNHTALQCSVQWIVARPIDSICAIHVLAVLHIMIGPRKPLRRYAAVVRHWECAAVI